MWKLGTKYAEFKRQSKRNTSKNQDSNPNISSTIDNVTKNETNTKIYLNIQEQPHPNNFSQNFELPPRWIPRVSKKVFKEDDNKGDEEEGKPDNCFSFTNQTEMFDNYDSNNSTLSNRMHEVIKEEDLSNRHDENESFTIKIDNDIKLHSSFINLTTPKNVFFSSSNNNNIEQKEPVTSFPDNSFGAEPAIKNINGVHINWEQKSKSILFYLLQNYSFKSDLFIAIFSSSRNQLGKENSYSKYLSKVNIIEFLTFKTITLNQFKQLDFRKYSLFRLILLFIKN